MKYSLFAVILCNLHEYLRVNVEMRTTVTRAREEVASCQDTLRAFLPRSLRFLLVSLHSMSSLCFGSVFLYAK